MLNKCIKCLQMPWLIAISLKYLGFTTFLEKWMMPLLVLFMRFWMAKIFWYSGLTKISSWDATVYLFKEEYKVPIVPPELAAYFATGFELLCPVLLVLGFASRLATLPLLAMTAVIQFTYLDLIDHRYWAMLLCLIFFYGPGKFSVDHLFKKIYINLK